jgi:myosin heavy subunit
VAEEWLECKEGMSFMGVADELFTSMTKLLAATVVMGDFEFTEGGNDDASISAGNTAKVAQLMGVEIATLTSSLQTSSTITRGEKIMKNLNKLTAISYRDALGKGVFSKIFDWIFETCNNVLLDPKAPSKLI